jgi:hypothetical protein
MGRDGIDGWLGFRFPGFRFLGGWEVKLGGTGPGAWRDAWCLVAFFSLWTVTVIFYIGDVLPVSRFVCFRKVSMRVFASLSGTVTASLPGELQVTGTRWFDRWIRLR